jgi:chromatin assembly factor 1 subunit A
VKATKEAGKEAPRWGERRDTRHKQDEADDIVMVDENGNELGTGPGTEARAAVPHLRRKLLQFVTDLRPAFYGSWPASIVTKTSAVVTRRRPLRQDPQLDYTVDSADEWEEEEEGESLSGNEDDDDEEEAKAGKAAGGEEEEDEEADGFVVPDGYLSVEEREEDEDVDTTTAATQQEEEDQTTTRQLKRLDFLTQQAKRVGRPLVITTLSRAPTADEETKEKPMLLHGDPALLAAFAVTLLDQSLVIAPLTPPRQEAKAGRDRLAGPGGDAVGDAAAAQGHGDGSEVRSAKKQKKTSGKEEGFPEALRKAFVVHLLGHPKLKVTAAAEAFTALHLQDGATNLAVKRELRSIAEYCNKQWEIKPEV